MYVRCNLLDASFMGGLEFLEWPLIWMADTMLVCFGGMYMYHTLIVQSSFQLE